MDEWEYQTYALRFRCLSKRGVPCQLLRAQEAGVSGPGGRSVRSTSSGRRRGSRADGQGVRRSGFFGHVTGACLQPGADHASPVGRGVLWRGPRRRRTHPASPQEVRARSPAPPVSPDGARRRLQVRKHLSLIGTKTSSSFQRCGIELAP